MQSAPLATQDLGLGTAYERVAIYKLFERWCKALSIHTACEGPLDGMAGIPGLHLLGLAKKGVSVTVCLPQDDALARVRTLYRRFGVDSRLTTRVLSVDAIPADPVDALVSYNALPYVSDWRAYLDRLFAARARWFLVVVSNPVSYGTYLRRLQRTARRENVVELFDHEAARETAIEPELSRRGRIVAHDYLDCPWWPDFLLPARKNLAGELIGKVRGALGASAASAAAERRFVFDEQNYPFFEGEAGYEETMRAIRWHPVFDSAPTPVARFFGHLHSYLVEKQT
jgi:hypothetical protein